LKKKHKDIERLGITNSWVRCKPRLARCMNLIDDNDLFYLDNDVDEIIDMNMTIILLQLFKANTLAIEIPS
jgi:hypothetical protein